MLGPCPSVYDCLWPSQSVGLPPNPSSPASYMRYKSECVCVYVLAFLSVSVCMFWLVFLLFSKSNQLPNNSIQTLAARAMDKDMDMAQSRSTLPPTDYRPASPTHSCTPTHTHTLTTHLFHLAHLSAVCPGLRLAVIFTVKSICSRQKQHLILL